MVEALVSVRSVDEALLAAAAGVRRIDLKEPRDGALGALPDAVLRDIVAALRGAGYGGEISATTGDHPPGALATLVQEAQRVAAQGVDVVKVGVLPGPGGTALLGALAALPLRVVPVLMVDQGLDPALADAACARPFHALMIDTVGKRGGSVLQRLDTLPLRRWIDMARAQQQVVGLAGALRLEDLDAVRSLAPDFAGFRSAVCANGREGPLDPLRLQAVLAQLAAT